MTFASCSAPSAAWSTAEEQRAAGRIADLRRFVPDGAVAPSTPISGAISPTFFASEVEGVAAALDTFVAAPTDRAALDEALGRVRALRGISALKELPPLADVADAIEHAAKTSVGEGRALTAQHAALYNAAAEVLRRAARELRTSGRPDASAPEVRRFAEAAGALQRQTRDEDEVVPVSNAVLHRCGPARRLARRAPTHDARVALPNRDHLVGGTPPPPRRRCDCCVDGGGTRPRRPRPSQRFAHRPLDDRELRVYGCGALFRERRVGRERARPHPALIDRFGRGLAGDAVHESAGPRRPTRGDRTRPCGRSRHRRRPRPTRSTATHARRIWPRRAPRPHTVRVGHGSPNAGAGRDHRHASHTADADRRRTSSVPANRPRGLQRARSGPARATRAAR